jgi:RNA polymerase sigma-70 factor (ECF subfamily)
LHVLVPLDKLSRDVSLASDRAGVAAVVVPAGLSIVVDIEERHGQALFGFVRRLGLSDPEAEDCVQETLLRLALQLASARPIDDAKGWIFRTGYRIAMDEHRLRRRLRGIVERLQPPPSIDLATTTDHEALWAEVDRLTKRQREVIYLRFRADLSFEQVSAVLGISSSAARSHCTHAVQTLRERLDWEGSHS